MNDNEIKIFERPCFLISRHLEQLNKAKNENQEERIVKLRMIQIHENLLYAYWKKLYTTKKENPFFGYKNIGKLKIESDNKSLTGEIYTLELESIFGNIQNKSIKLVEIVPETIIFDQMLNNPLPFIFLPTGSLVEVREFLSQLQRKASLFAIDNCECIFLEPYSILKLGLDFLIRDLLRDDNINMLLVGFIYYKDDSTNNLPLN